MMLYLLNSYQACFLMVKSCAQVRNLSGFLAKQTWHKFICGFGFLVFFLANCAAMSVAQTLVSLRRRFIRCTLCSMTVGLVISVAQLAGNQPLSPSRILSPKHQANQSIHKCIPFFFFKVNIQIDVSSNKALARY